MVDVGHRIALHAEHSLGAERGGAHDLRLQRKPVAVAAVNVHDRPDALLAGESHSRQRWPSAPAGSEVSLVVTSRADSLGVALAAYGFGVGIGVACAYVPMVALVGAWFECRRTLALGVAVAGIGLGTLTIPPATAALIEEAGWRDS
jgi:MFS family permease